MRTILITAIGGDIAQSFATIVRESYPDWKLLGCDVHDRHGGSLYVDECFIAPMATAPDYETWLQELLSSRGVEVCVPMSEAELDLLGRSTRRQIGSAALLMPNSLAIEVGGDKLTTARFLASIGCPSPWTIPVAERNERTIYPCIFKPRQGAGSKNVAICQTPADVEYMARRCQDAVLQELLLPADQEVTVAIYRTQGGAIFVLPLLRRLVGGQTGWARVIANPAIEAQSMRLAEALDLRGAINAQLRVTARGPVIFEVNSRFSSTVLIRHRMGFQDAMWSLRELQGQKVNPMLPPVNMSAVRTQGAAVLSNR